MTKTNNIVEQAEAYIQQLFSEELSHNHLFHNLQHTRQVVEAVEEISEKSDLKDKEKELLLLAAWFHDSGYTKAYDGHEEEGCRIVESFLKERDYDEKDIQQVQELIRSTKYNHKPQNKLAEILHDADLAHVGKKNFFRRNALLRLEWENVLDKKFSDLEWEELQLDFLVKTEFFTVYAKENYSQRRAKNIEKQRKNITKAKKANTRIKTGKDFGRGIDTLYRTTFRNHINISEIADGKANMMISINTIILSVIITLSGAGFTFSEVTPKTLRFIIPVVFLLLGCLLSVIFAIMSARPKVTKLSIDEETLNNKETSLLYFGNFLEVAKASFVDYLSELKKDQEQLYDSMALDLYQLGRVLKVKYRLLSISYNIFMGGLVLAVTSFIGVLIYSVIAGMNV